MASWQVHCSLLSKYIFYWTWYWIWAWTFLVNIDIFDMKKNIVLMVLGFHQGMDLLETGETWKTFLLYVFPSIEWQMLRLETDFAPYSHILFFMASALQDKEKRHPNKYNFGPKGWCCYRSRWCQREYYPRRGGLLYMDVSNNSGTPEIINFNRVFHYNHPF